METAEASVSFLFEEDFMEDNIRCIPMIVRFKLDACGIKLKLSEWSKFSAAERSFLTGYHLDTQEHIAAYRRYLQDLVFTCTKQEATDLPVEAFPEWAMVNQIPSCVAQRMMEYNRTLMLSQWAQLSDLQRFALIKLSRSGHEHKNFQKAIKEFGLTRMAIL